ncbi:non-homologous end joining protein Ku [Cellulomonas denverensis]|uniref:non-homologous end joining protein Ku n=1 Tax=Cellulomonas denverensis TaxID=264297 RepID=UPI0035E72D35
MRAIWKGAVAFGLVNVPVKLYAATGEHEVPMHQVHRTDGGRIRYRRVCSIEDEPVEMSEIAKGYETDDGRLVVLTDEDLAQLPLTTEREIEVLEFVPADQVDPILLAKTYYLEPDRTAAKPYALLREALAATDRMAVVKVALRQRESMAVLRVREDVICLQTLLWPDEVRAADFPILDNDVQVRPQELAMASSLVEQLAGDFDPSGFEDRYVTALESVIEQKLNSGAVQERPAAEEEVGEGGRGGEVVDLLAALQRSVEKARSDRGEEAPERPTRSRSSAAKTAKSGATKAATSKTSATKATGTKSGTKAGGTKAAGSAKTTATAKKPAAKKPAARKPAAKRAS